MDFATALTYGQSLAIENGRNYWIYRINGRGAKYQITGTYGMATNGKILDVAQIVAMVAA